MFASGSAESRKLALLFCGAHPVRMRDAQAGGVELGMGASLVPASSPCC